MNTQRVKDIIVELEAEIKLKVDAISALKSLLDSDREKALPAKVWPESFPGVEINSGDSYMDLSIKAIEVAGKPIHIKSILEFIRTAKRNPNIARRSVEATLIQHIKTKGNDSRIVKVSPGVYALRRYPRLEPAA